LLISNLQSLTAGGVDDQFVESSIQLPQLVVVALCGLLGASANRLQFFELLCCDPHGRYSNGIRFQNLNEVKYLAHLVDRQFDDDGTASLQRLNQAILLQARQRLTYRGSAGAERGCHRVPGPRSPSIMAFLIEV
jgi:hypothetical protein